ncbi:hypothetical protein [Flavisolibacter tropicus]|uniref:Uncharacterized protein n=1 Tax=Flavisolibacter tropicus TaxID=1492898 RepID=A0A172U070_9BACT|nr:hypothetical protein [Flavisolibacter tropicus]ANE52387.1 hypothetical protein SY85_19765 [Flavisolibacter tropicus]
MNTAKLDLHADSASGNLKLKEILKRHNMPYEERREGNATIIGIKARAFTQKAAQLFTRPCADTAG